MRKTIMTALFAASALAAVTAQARIQLTGTVKDPTGAPIDRATVSVFTAEQTIVATARTEARETFRIHIPSAGRYLLVASAPNLGESRIPVHVGDTNPAPIEVVLQLQTMQEDVTVTASPNIVEDVQRVGQPVSVIDSLDIATRVTTAVAQAVEGETGVQLQ